MSISIFDRILSFLSQHMLLIGGGMALVLVFAIICVALAVMAVRKRGTAYNFDAGQPGFDTQAPSSDLSLEDKVVSTLRTHGIIQAIKVHRERTGLGLAESKHAVEEIARRHRII